jgi:E3 ubiquitin-protein ligase HUWE1
LKVLQDKENAVLIGTAMDELIRHHPSLKVPVFEAIKSTLSKIEDLGNAYVVPKDMQQWYKLVPVSAASSADEDVDMEVADSEGAGGPPATDSEQSGNDPTNGEDPRSHDNLVVSFIDVVGRVRPSALDLDWLYLTNPSFRSSWKDYSRPRPTAEILFPAPMGLIGSAG